MPKSLCRTHYCAGLVACLLLAGCKPATAVVTGKVRFQRQPLTSGSVLIFSQDKQIISGLILPDGTYRIANVPFGVARVTVRTHPLVPPGFNHPSACRRRKMLRSPRPRTGTLAMWPSRNDLTCRKNRAWW